MSHLLPEAVALSVMPLCAVAAAVMGGTTAEVVLEAGPDWVPVPMEPWIEPDSALDFSHVVPHHEPAGKFGRVVASGDHFEFERLPGVPQRFYGVNICNDANTPSTPEAADRFAVNLARMGYNAIRIHHHERWLLEKDGETSDVAEDTVPDPACLDHFDTLVAACIRHGLYITTDLYVSRPVPRRSIGIDRDGIVAQDSFKFHCAFWEPDGEPLCASRRILLTHLTEVQNSGIKYRDQDRGILLNWGHLPHLMRAGKTEIELKLDGCRDKDSSLITSHSLLRGGIAPTVFALSPSGVRRAEIPATFDVSTGTLRFTADVALNPRSATYLYEIARD